MNVTLKIVFILLCFTPLAILMVREFRRSMDYIRALRRASPQPARRRRPF